MIPVSRVLPVFAKHMIVLGGFPCLIEQSPVEGIIDLQNSEVFEVLSDTIDRKDLFDKGFPTDGIGSSSDSTGEAFLGIDLSDPSGISITGRSDENIGMEITKLESFQTLSFYSGHVHLQVIRGLYQKLTWHLGSDKNRH